MNKLLVVLCESTFQIFDMILTINLFHSVFFFHVSVYIETRKNMFCKRDQVKFS